MYDPDHPVITTEFLIATPEIKRVCEIALDRIFMRRTGVIFYGPSRLGKSRCFEVLNDSLSRYVPRAYVIRVVPVDREGQRCTQIIMQLADSLGYGDVRKSRDTRYIVLKYLVNTIYLRIKELGCNQCVCLLDEFQRLRSDDLYQLVDLYNLLEMRGVKLTVVSFAMPEVIPMRGMLINTEQRQITARLMSELIEFKGCRDVTDIEAILNGYDVFTEYPKGSGISFTKAFLPEAFGGGFRLLTYAPHLWQAMNSYASGPYVNNLPMQHILEALTNILRWHSKDDSRDLKLSEDDFYEAVRSGNFEEFCKVEVLPKK
ncbi:ATP-binding protein [Pseudomonas sp. PDNC002]|uniref:ATP-binding protein n=1 Tax=Pseudomonas denitrificans TaxID=43306 RepID=A0A9X7R3T3_PSEDE|nr:MULTISPECIES: ATP-binding protein [Pseudomonadaceae]QEY71752.1 ATP-binding protein [Pseudomonas denitrificans (nom. rej.)]QRY77758.1 ATP-binding protein [Pseudomonas sp. PDNC002]